MHWIFVNSHTPKANVIIAIHEKRYLLFRGFVGQ